MKTFIFSALFFFQPLILTAQLTDSIIIAYYPFNGNANDESGNGNNGTVYGTLLTTDRFDSIGSAYKFDGYDDYIEIGTLSELTDSFNSFSLSFWIKSGSEVSQWSSLIRSVNNDPYGITFGLDFHRNGSNFEFGRLSFDTRDNSGNFFSFAVNVPEIFNEQWHFIVYNFEDISNNKTSVFIDGKSVDITYITIQGPTNYSQFDNPVVLGAGNNRGIIERFYEGSLDDFRICNRILTNKVIDSLFHINGWHVTDNPIAWYPFNGNADDASGNGNNGTVYGAKLTANRFDSVAGSAYYFDGIDDYIEIGTLPDLTQSYNSFSLSFWIKSGSDVSQWTSIIRSVNNAAYGMTLGFDIHRNGREFQFGRLSFDTRSNDSKFFSFTVDVPEIFNNQWHHMVYNLEDIGNNKASVYIDGENKNITYHTTQGPTYFTQFENPFVLGAGNARGIIEKFYKGSLDDFIIFDYVLSESEIDSLYHEGGFINLDVNLNHASCYNEADGSIEINPVDGHSPYRFNWSTGDTTTIIDSLPVGEYYVFITDTNNSRVRFETFLITEPSPIMIYSLYHNTITCYADNTGLIDLSASGGAGNLLYSLSNNNSWQENGFFTGLFAGEYFVTIMDENNCKINSDTIIIDQNDQLRLLTIIGKTEVEEFEQVFYSVDEVIGSQYDWFVSGGNIMNGQTTNVVDIHWGSSGAGKIGVIENSADGCRGDTAWLSVNISGLFINEVNDKGLKIYPNPLTENTTIQFPNPATERYQLYIKNLEGQIVKIINNIYSDKVVISKEYLPRGYFLIELRGSKVYKGKLVVW